MIRLYQRYLSPYKGFSCAYRVKKNRCSCSEFARRVATRFGLLKLPDLLQRRFKKCERAAKVLDYEAKKPKPARSSNVVETCTDITREGAAECVTNAGIELACNACDGV